MNRRLMLTISSMFSILMVTFHLTDDIVRGFEKGGLSNLAVIPICVIWLYGALVLGERRLGYIIMLLGAILGLAIPVIHMTGKGVGGEIAQSSGAFFFIWGIIALGVSSLFSLVLSVRELWSLLISKR